MPFWTYMLHCGDRTIYVGHTDDLETRLGQHQQGVIPGYTHQRRPVTLVWSGAFESRDEARAAERRLKGWGRPKKLALIRGDRALIRSLSQTRQERASTSSANLEVGVPLRQTEVPDCVFLHPHFENLPSQAFSLEGSVRRKGNTLGLRFRMIGDLSSVVMPRNRLSQRKDKLWLTTCFEAFIAHGIGNAYREINLSPSTEWASYDFQSYRAGMTNSSTTPDSFAVVQKAYELYLEAVVPLPSQSTRIALAAVIEQTNGTKSYWALRHPPGPPDFHHPDCFALPLPAPR